MQTVLGFLFVFPPNVQMCQSGKKIVPWVTLFFCRNNSNQLISKYSCKEKVLFSPFAHGEVILSACRTHPEKLVIDLTVQGCSSGVCSEKACEGPGTHDL